MAVVFLPRQITTICQGRREEKIPDKLFLAVQKTNWGQKQKYVYELTKNVYLSLGCKQNIRVGDANFEGRQISVKDAKHMLCV